MEDQEVIIPQEIKGEKLKEGQTILVHDQMMHHIAMKLEVRKLLRLFCHHGFHLI